MIQIKAIRVVTFDLDDTLWDNRPVMLEAERSLYDWLAEHYPRITRNQTLDGLRQLRVRLATEQPDLRYRMTALRKRSLQLAARSAGYEESMVERAFAQFLEARHRITPYPDVAPGLQQLRTAGYRIGALTNGNADVRRLDIGRLFDFLLDAESVGEAKPHPLMFEEACRRSGATPPQLVHIGDEPEIDLAGAQAAGVGAIWMNRLGRPADARFHHHPEVGDMAQLLKLFGLH